MPVDDEADTEPDFVEVGQKMLPGLEENEKESNIDLIDIVQTRATRGITNIEATEEKAAMAVPPPALHGHPHLPPASAVIQPGTSHHSSTQARFNCLELHENPQHLAGSVLSELGFMNSMEWLSGFLGNT